MRYGRATVAGIAIGAMLMVAWGSAGVVRIVTSPWRAGMSVTVDRQWVALNGYIGARNRGTAERDPAWVGAAPSRGAPPAVVLRLPNVVGRMHRNARVAKTIANAIRITGVRLLERATAAALAHNEGEFDADRR